MPRRWFGSDHCLSLVDIKHAQAFLIDVCRTSFTVPVKAHNQLCESFVGVVVVD
ncbi:hypothetical protein [Morganella morganii]|uniref:hypothetical protein n=1 Tax=Morganella morganii TaxID=582 RepID=UPI00163A1D0F|nr:hypothetical protein [Morganella morganii]